MSCNFTHRTSRQTHRGFLPTFDTGSRNWNCAGSSARLSSNTRIVDAQIQARLCCSSMQTRSYYILSLTSLGDMNPQQRKDPQGENRDACRWGASPTVSVPTMPTWGRNGEEWGRGGDQDTRCYPIKMAGSKVGLLARDVVGTWEKSSLGSAAAAVPGTLLTVVSGQPLSEQGSSLHRLARLSRLLCSMRDKHGQRGKPDHKDGRSV